LFEGDAQGGIPPWQHKRAVVVADLDLGKVASGACVQGHDCRRD
jgi:hypothetical protein